MNREQSSTTRDLGGGPLRVLQISSSISQRSEVMGVLTNYLRHMDHSQVVFDFLRYATPDGAYREEIRTLGGCCYVVDARNHIGHIQSSLGQVLKQYAGQYPVAHLHNPILSRFLCPVVRRHGVRSFAVHSHATAYSDSRLWSLRNWLVRRDIETYSDACLICSRTAGDFLFGSDRFRVVPNTIDAETCRFNESIRTEVRSRLGLGEAPVVGHVGRFGKQKNHRFLIDVCTKLFRAHSDARLMLIGDGPLQPGIEAVVAERGLSDCVPFLGDRKDVPGLYQAMDMFLLPSPYEGLSMMGVEAQYARLPLVCFDEVANEITIREVSFLPLDMPVPQWTHHVSQTLDRGRGPRRRAEGEQATRVAGFDITHEAERLAHCYHALAEW